VSRTCNQSFIAFDGLEEVAKRNVNRSQLLQNLDFARRSFGLGQSLYQIESVLKNLCSLLRFKPPPRRICRQLQVLDGTQPISALFEVIRHPRRLLFQVCLSPLS
jgi:hypothetical protein